MHRVFGTLLLTAVLAGSAGCFAAVRIYDAPRNDYHRWNSGEDRAYRAYLAERHFEYREFKRLQPREQEEYWAWRHDHPDRDRR
jgi:hypothetical protein